MKYNKICLLCKSEKHRVIRNNLRYGIPRRVLQCDACDFVFLEPLHIDKINKKKYYTGKNYRRIYGPNLKKQSSPKEIFDTYLPFQQNIIKRIGRVVKPNIKVLDVGCSTGHFLCALKGLVADRVGLELNKDHVNFIKKNLDFTVYSEPIENAILKEGPFDLITVLQVLEHIDNPMEFLSGVAKNLKSGGYLYLELPNIDDALLSIYHSQEYADFYYREPHVSYFSQKTLRFLLKRAGFKGKISTVQDYNFLNHLHWLFTGKPQDNFTLGVGDPILVKNNKKGVAKDLNDFIKRADSTYKKILIKHELGENLAFLGQKS